MIVAVSNVTSQLVLKLFNVVFQVEVIFVAVKFVIVASAAVKLLTFQLVIVASAEVKVATFQFVAVKFVTVALVEVNVVMSPEVAVNEVTVALVNCESLAIRLSTLAVSRLLVVAFNVVALITFQVNSHSEVTLQVNVTAQSTVDNVTSDKSKCILSIAFSNAVESKEILKIVSHSL